ncbi:MAG TPA: peptide chain release factor 1 [Thermoleophilia bacterium]|nr:peptide chain release factor 1 [Thermoleophilia bacterium]HQJ98848.1 peptide chain release factor 1 [Thermoleophilia bacterium]
MIDNLIDEIERTYDELTAQLADPDVLGDRTRYTQVARRHAGLQETHDLVMRYRDAERVAAEAEALLDAEAEADDELRQLAQQELVESRKRLDELAAEIRAKALTDDPNDGKDVIIEIRAGAGGDEACIFAGELARMYTRYAQSKGFEVEILAANENDDGGYKEVILEVRGQGAYSALKYEGGVHRVQRVPVTESTGRIHTSTATVAVLPEAEEIEVEIHPNDLRVDIFRARGPGGQSVNTTDSAVRITHVPTGVSVSCQDEKSQLQNKERALRILRARLYEIEQAKQDEERGDARRSMVGSGDRAQKIRTYNFPQNRVSDHRVGVTSHRIAEVMEGDLDEFVEALAAEDRRKQLAAAGAE